MTSWAGLQDGERAPSWLVTSSLRVLFSLSPHPPPSPVQFDWDTRLALLLLMLKNDDGYEFQLRPEFWAEYIRYYPDVEDSPSLLLATEAELAELQDERLADYFRKQQQRCDALYKKHYVSRTRHCQAALAGRTGRSLYFWMFELHRVGGSSPLSGSQIGLSPPLVGPQQLPRGDLGLLGDEVRTVAWPSPILCKSPDRTEPCAVWEGKRYPHLE